MYCNIVASVYIQSLTLSQSYTYTGVFAKHYNKPLTDWNLMTFQLSYVRIKKCPKFKHYLL
jgi:hypothetical protein